MDYKRNCKQTPEAIRGSLRARVDPQEDRRFTDDQIRSIRQRVVDGEAQTVLAREFNIGRPAIWKIIHRKSYTHVE